MAFTHLHVHTEYSLLDGAARIKGVVSRAKELGMTSLAITDHGNMFGVIDFYKECNKQGIKPLIGCEVYMAPRTMADKDPDLDRYQNHLLLIAENNEGYKNLIKIVSAGYIKGMYYKPRVDKSVLREHRGGIIATSACLFGKVQQLLLARDYEGAKAEAMEMDEIFGHGNFFLEIQDQGLDDEKRINPDIITGVSLFLLFVFLHISQGYLTVILAHITFCTPYVVLNVLPKLSQMNPNVYEAALDLGATPFQALRKVMIPALRPGMISGFILSFTMSLDDFAVTFFTRGTIGLDTLSTFIYTDARKGGLTPELRPLMTIIFLIILAVLLFINIRSSKNTQESK